MTNSPFNNASLLKAVDKDIQASIEYNESIMETLSEMCRPLFDDVPDVAIFEYSKYYKNGTFYYLCTHPTWHRYYLTNYSKNSFFLGHMKTIFDEKINFHMWDTNNIEHIKNEDHLKFVDARRKHGIWGGYTIYKHHDEFIECWCFSSNKQNHFNINTYINNTSNFECFIIYFKEQAANVINDSNAKKISITEDNFFLNENLNFFLTQKEKKKKFFKKILLKKYILETPKGPIKLSLREIQCLGYRSKGLSDKEIAQKIINRGTNESISVGTVHAHFVKIKLKAYEQTLTQLRSFFSNSTLANLPLEDL